VNAVKGAEMGLKHASTQLHSLEQVCGDDQRTNILMELLFWGAEEV
jgi:hypothetical protein